jgi:hypothetical protein
LLPSFLSSSRPQFLPSVRTPFLAPSIAIHIYLLFLLSTPFSLSLTPSFYPLPLLQSDAFRPLLSQCWTSLHWPLERRREEQMGKILMRCGLTIAPG